MKKRLDNFIVEKNIFKNLKEAQYNIMIGKIKVNNIIIDKIGFQVKEEDKIEIIKDDFNYVSRGALKLKAGLDYFKISLKEKVCLDVGVSTGGFSDCMLQEGAKKVYGIDVGRGQVHEKIKKNDKFIFSPNTNVRFLNKDIFKENIDFVAVDVSFISLEMVLIPLTDALLNSEMILLIKPQFELQKNDLIKGIVKNEELRKKALDKIKYFINNKIKNCKILGVVDSPVKGSKGNVEFLMYLNVRR